MKGIIDYRDLVGRLDMGRATGVDVSFSPEEAWILREHIRFLADGGPIVESGLLPPRDPGKPRRAW